MPPTGCGGEAPLAARLAAVNLRGVFSTCCFCDAPLGANDAIEHFPVGRRLAFDGERGRLWAVCPRCGRWNLAPIEERWEALEACERAYRSATKRVSTDNIALARLKDGTDLVRIGRPLLPEYAAWRYGDVIATRHRHFRQTRIGSVSSQLAGLGALGAVLAFGLHPATYFVPMTVALGWEVSRDRRARPALATSLPARRALARRLARHPGRSRFARGADGAWQIEVTPSTWKLMREPGAPAAVIAGAEARAVFPPLLVALAPWGGARRDIEAAVEVVERAPDLETVFDRFVESRQPHGTRANGAVDTAAAQFAFEMALSEDDERRALAGDLGTLYARWQEAERVARIADQHLSRPLDEGAR